MSVIVALSNKLRPSYHFIDFILSLLFKKFHVFNQHYTGNMRDFRKWGSFLFGGMQKKMSSKSLIFFNHPVYAK